MGKKRTIIKLAKEFDVSTDALMHHLEKSGFKLRNHMSLVSDEMYTDVCKKYGHKAAEVDDEYEFRTQLKRKKAQEEAKKREEQKKLEERLKVATEFSKIRPKIKHEAEEIARKQEEPTKKTAAEAVADDSSKPKKKSETKPGGKTKLSSKMKNEKDTIEDTNKSTLKRSTGEAGSLHSSLKTKDLKEKHLVEATETESVKNKKKSSGTERSDKTSDAHEKRARYEKKAKGQSDQRVKAPIPGQKIESSQKSVSGEPVKKEASEEKKKRRRRRRKKKTTDETRHDTPENMAKGETRDIEDEYQKAVVDKKSIKKQQHRKESEIAVTHPGKKNKKKRKKKKAKISDAEVEESIRKTMATMGEDSRLKKRKKKTKEKEVESEDEDTRIIKVSEYVSAAELAENLDVEPSQVIKKCFELGMMVSINQRLDMDIIEAVADEFDYSVEILPDYGEDFLEDDDDIDNDADLLDRPPVVTIMGHVDHGKTSLLDYIRESNIIAGESGGITQHIGAYEVAVNGKAITFLDTPGHEAFTAMRARGAQATDIVVLIVAADDAVMPQTIEAINHAKAAGVPIIVAINKIDKPNANIDFIKKQLAEHDVLIEEWGGKYQSVDISAKYGTGIDKLLDLILLEAEILELKANPTRLSRGVVIEAQLDKGKGIVATVLIQKGTLKVGDPFISGQYNGKVRSIYNERNHHVKNAPPSAPVQVVGFTGMPAAGDNFVVLENEKDTRIISLKRQQLKREQDIRRIKHLTLDEISKRIKLGGIKELSIIVKGDMDGSVQAISDSLMKLSNQEVAIDVIHRGVGAITESDVLLASASEAFIIGFHVRPTLKAREIALLESVDIRLYTIIYDAISEVKDALEGLLDPEITEEVRGTVEVRATFKIPKVGTIAGCYVVSGKILRNDNIKLYREDKLIYEGRVESLRRIKDDVKEASAGFECGVGLAGFDDIKVDDIIEPYITVKVKRKLTPLTVK